MGKQLTAKQVKTAQDASREEMWVRVIDMADALIDSGFSNNLDIHLVCHEGHKPYGYLLMNRGCDNDEIIELSRLVGSMGGSLNLVQQRDENGTFNLRIWPGNSDV